MLHTEEAVPVWGYSNISKVRLLVQAHCQWNGFLARAKTGRHRRN